MTENPSGPIARLLGEVVAFSRDIWGRHQHVADLRTGQEPEDWPTALDARRKLLKAARDLREDGYTYEELRQALDDPSMEQLRHLSDGYKAFNECAKAFELGYEKKSSGNTSELGNLDASRNPVRPHLNRAVKLLEGIYQPATSP